jgi:F-type H+-transporting ATPase subunit a
MNVAPTNVIHLFGDVWITDTVLSTWVMMAFVIALGLFLVQRRPTVIQMYLDFIHGLVTDVMDERVAHIYVPFLASLFLFIALANSIGIVPFLVAPTRDISTPLAMALVVFFAVHYYGVRALGPLGYLKSLASPLYLSPLTLPLEIIGQLSRTLSLTLRLFGNVVSGELVVAVIAFLVPLIAPLPLVGLSLFTGLLQAYIFTILAAVYISAGVEAGEEDESLDVGAPA